MAKKNLPNPHLPPKNFQFDEMNLSNLPIHLSGDQPDTCSSCGKRTCVFNLHNMLNSWLCVCPECGNIYIETK